MNAISTATKLKYIDIHHYRTEQGEEIERQQLSYQTFGPPLGKAPVVLVVHALTGNSSVAGPKGWWKEIVGPENPINTRHYTVIAFDIPGNGYSGRPESLLPRPDIYTARDVATLFHRALLQLDVHHLHAAIGGSLGGGIIWELAALAPDFIQRLIPIASDWKSTDWIIAHNRVQKEILEHTGKPLEIARMMAMLFYRSGKSFDQKFSRRRQDAINIYQVESWLLYHGEKLRDRFHLQAYKTMNHLLSTIDITRGRGKLSDVLPVLSCDILQIGIDSDIFFDPEENQHTHHQLQEAGLSSQYAEINSIHGHDAFLIEHDQLREPLRHFFPLPGHQTDWVRPAGSEQTRNIPLILFGPGNVGSTLLRQIRQSREHIRHSRNVELSVIAIANSKTLLFDDGDLTTRFHPDSLQQEGMPYQFPELLQYLADQYIHEFIAIDATTGNQLAERYPELIRAGAHIASANKTANTGSQAFYQELRQLLTRRQRQFCYETNVGAGLPLIGTIRELHGAGEEIKKIRGIFSGSLSYIFNRFGRKQLSFSEIVEEARDFGLTEPNPLEDLSGTDVTRKLLILARELDLQVEWDSVQTESLIPPQLMDYGELVDFRSQHEILNTWFDNRKKVLPSDHVLRYIGEINVPQKQLQVSLQAVPTDSNLGHVKGADSIFEIYSRAYRQPMIIRGAGAGPEVTARGLLGDILKIATSAFR